MQTERNADILAQLAALTDAVARLDAAGVPVALAQAGAAPWIHLDVRHFRRLFAGAEVVVTHGATCDNYRAERDGVRYEAIDHHPVREAPTTETVRLPEAA